MSRTGLSDAVLVLGLGEFGALAQQQIEPAGRSMPESLEVVGTKLVDRDTTRSRGRIAWENASGR